MAFAECKKLKYIEFPDTLEYIDDEAFWDVDMTKVEIKCSDKIMKLLKESKVI